MKTNLIIALFLALVITVAITGLNIYDDRLPYGRMWETPAVRPHEKPIFVMESGVVPFHGGEALLKAQTALALSSPIGGMDRPANIEAGKKVYSMYCQQCHGKHHDGYGTVGQSFAPLPTDLRSLKVQSLSEGTLFRHISYGVADGRQPPLATTIEMTDRWRVIAYVKSLGVRQ